MQKYIDLLNVGGSAFIQGMNIYSGGEPAGLTSSLLAQIPLYREHLTNRRLTIKTTSGRQTVLDWLRSHPGIRAETLDTWPNDAVVITKLVEEPVRLRRLKLSRFVKGTPPYRKYEELR